MAKRSTFNLHKAEEKFHKIAERAMKADKKIHRKIEKAEHAEDAKKKHKKDPKYSRKAESKIKTVMHEFGKGELHSGSKKGPVVKNPKQALAIAISEAKRRGYKVGKKKK